MRKSKIVFTLFLSAILLGLVLPCINFADETLTITTYYPSPYGSYRELSAYRMKIGQTYSTQAVTDNNLIVEGNVSIGTPTPKAALHVNGSVRFGGGFGDIDNNGVLSAMDFGYYKTYLADQTTILTDEQFARADMDGDGRVTWDDYAIFQHHYFGIPPFDKSQSIRDVAGSYGIISTTSGNIFYIRDNVGIGTTSPGGKLDVNGAIYQRGSSLHADYVFEPGYQLESIEEHASYMWKHKHLKSVPKAAKDENGQDIVEIGSFNRGVLEEMEKSYVYIQQLNECVKKQEDEIMVLRAEIKGLVK